MLSHHACALTQMPRYPYRAMHPTFPLPLPVMRPYQDIHVVGAAAIMHGSAVTIRTEAVGGRHGAGTQHRGRACGSPAGTRHRAAVKSRFGHGAVAVGTGHACCLAVTTLTSHRAAMVHNSAVAVSTGAVSSHHGAGT
eukprot:scaffold28036_cov21-Tisochrysis_lutea.AAC.1